MIQMARREYGSRRAVPHARKIVGQRLRAVREQRGLSQQALAERSGLTGKFIGEVERGEKSLSIDSLYHLASALGVKMGFLGDVPIEKVASTPDAERLLAMVATRRRPEELAKVQRVLRTLFGSRPRRR
jgi:transcriptional regulator with XRE-family HTH domain